MKLSFFFPYHDVSGVPVLFSRLAPFVAREYGADVEVVDYADGYMAQTLSGRREVRLTPFRRGVPLSIDGDRLLVMQSILPATMHRELQPQASTRLLFWTLYPMNFVQTLIPIGRARDWQAQFPAAGRLAGRTVLRRFSRDLRRFIEDLDRAGSLVFVDGTTYRTTCRCLGVKLSPPRYVPTLCPMPLENPGVARRCQAPLSVMWLGRLDDFKMPILLYTARELSALAAAGGPAIRFTVIGAGPLRHLLDDEPIAHERFAIVHAGTLEPEAVDRLLGSDADLLFAMGTSAIEGGKLGVPTVLLDIAYGKVPAGYVFRWLYDATDFNLGSMLRERRFEPGNDSLARILDAVVWDRRAASDRTFRYCVDHHSIESAARRFVDAARAASYEYGQMSPRLRAKGLVRLGYEWTRRRLRRRAFDKSARSAAGSLSR